MSEQTYFTLLTEKGLALFAQATALEVPVKLKTFAVGDGNGELPTPTASQTKLVNEVRRGAINTITIDEENPNQIIIQHVIPPEEGGFYIHEIGVFDENDQLIAVGNCPPSYKPVLSEGSGRTQVINMIIIVENTANVELKIDPTTVLATREYVDQLIESKMTEHEKSTNHPRATLSSLGFTQLSDDVTSDSITEAATINSVKKVYDKADNINKYGTAIIGELIEWGHDKMPNELFPDCGMEFLPLQGQAFDKTKYPLLALVYTSGTLPDMRTQFVRGTSASRSVLSKQEDAIRNITGKVGSGNRDAVGIFYAGYGGNAGGAFTLKNEDRTYAQASASSTKDRTSTAFFDASNVVPTAGENRPVNVAWNMIVRAK